MSEPDLAYEQGLADERAAIVAWLWKRLHEEWEWQWLAGSIERGEHNE